MSGLLALWLPILVSAVLVFVASSLIHMVFKWHLPDYRHLSNEDAVGEAIRAGSAGPGLYVLPYCKDMKDMADPAFVARYERGPVGMLILRQPGKPQIGPQLLKWFALSLGIAACAALAAVQSVGLGASAHNAGHLIGVISFLAYGAGSVTGGIWHGMPWIVVLKDLLDALIYATLSALAFWWLWPG